MANFYEPILCQRCKIPIKNINEIHKNSKSIICKSNKRVKNSYVYLMHDTTNDLLKIGYSNDPNRRHKEFIHNSTNQIILIGYFPGTKANENIIHSKFKSARFKREWFINETDIVNYFINHPEFIKGSC